ncbi:MAG: DUF2313 domain-containing protein [Rhodospirillum sp.]|nr:DUF2313 domain-containing protein [Rhodospirillum sp.]MCF8500171.1 DUF2313 domain-containing protein [Rhodospirillum sp.]
MTVLAPIIGRAAAAYLSATLRLLPTGSAWPRSPESVLYKTAAAAAEEYARIDARAGLLMEEADPRTTLELLAEWESSFGLPDPCSGQADSIEERRARLVVKVTMVGGQSIPYFINLAKALGYDIEITEHKARQHGDRHGDIYGGWEWNFVFTVAVPEITWRPRRHGWFSGEPYSAWGNAAVVCMMNRLKPSHTVARYQFTEV